jgi:hypothetical protein
VQSRMSETIFLDPVSPRAEDGVDRTQEHLGLVSWARPRRCCAWELLRGQSLP